MSAKAACLGMFSTKEFPLDHRYATDARSQRHHHNIRETLSCAGIHFAK